MASNYTSNYGLCQWEPDDKVLRTEFNADNAKIDTAIAAVNSRVSSVSGSKADQSALTALSQAVSQGMDLRNCRVVTGSYTGSGKFGPGNPNTLSFTQKPLFVFIIGETVSIDLTLVRGMKTTTGSRDSTAGTLTVSWTDRSVSWYAPDSVSASLGPGYQLNNVQTYLYFAVLEL